MNKITHYLRNAVTSQNNQRIDFKKSMFVAADPQTIKQGEIDSEIANELFAEYLKKNKDKKEITSIQVIIALKTIKTNISETVALNNSTDELSAIFYLPARLGVKGELRIGNGQFPWFVREYLSPMVDYELCIGDSERADNYLCESIDKKHQIESWDDYFKYAVDMYEYVTQCEFDSSTVNDLETDNKCYIFLDETVNSAFHILNLYNDIIKSFDKPLPLYQNFISDKTPESRPLIDNSNLESMQRHCGQMGGKFPLSPSQREAVNHFNALENGEILAVNGPPGTGKTTLLQSIVANIITENALSKKDAPIIIAASTNNQAVTNIIDSFSHVESGKNETLDKRWIPDFDGVAAYFPSTTKEAEARKNKYPIGIDVIKLMNDEDYIQKSKKQLLKMCSEHFSKSMSSIAECQQSIHEELKLIDQLKTDLLENIGKLLKYTNGRDIGNVIDNLNSQIKNLTAKITESDKSIDDLFNFRKYLINRIEEWTKSFTQLPWYIRIFRNFKFAHTQIYNWSFTFKNIDEIDFLNGKVTLDEITREYHLKIQELDLKIREAKSEKKHNQHLKSTTETTLNDINKTLQSNLYISRILKEHNVDLNDTDSALNRCDILKINSLLDTSVRYTEFWLTVHYYECEWLLQKPLTEKQQTTNISSVVSKRFKQLAMLAPCMVMTFYMLPSLFKVTDENENKKRHLLNFADLLIVDEAGQTSIEIAAPSFAIAKSAVVVGDEDQIPPVWGVSKALDISMALKNGVISTIPDFKKIEDNGLNTSMSSVMKVASRVCPYNKFEQGLFLSEHRRCYNEIIGYCNDLVYNGHLEPLRGNGSQDKKRTLDINKYPIIGFYDISTANSIKSGTSRLNMDEAKEIASWLKLHYNELIAAYSDEIHQNKITKKDVVAIVTPFKEQVRVIKKQLQDTLNSDANNISVGTVHTFQGGERKIIIFSTVYGDNDNCFFIDNNKNLMNVAVSRAKDAFWVFGSNKTITNKSKNSPSGLLDSYVTEHKIIV